MPPKKPEAAKPSKKTEIKKKEKVIEVKIQIFSFAQILTQLLTHRKKSLFPLMKHVIENLGWAWSDSLPATIS